MAAAAGAASSSFVPSNSARRLPFRPTRKFLLLAAIPKNTRWTPSLKPPRRLLHPLAASSSSSPPPPEDAETTDPVKLAFARAAAYKKERANPTPKPPPPPSPPPQPSAKESGGSKGAFERALEYRNGNGGGPDGGGSAPLKASPTSGEYRLILTCSASVSGPALPMLFATRIELVIRRKWLVYACVL